MVTHACRIPPDRCSLSTMMILEHADTERHQRMMFASLASDIRKARTAGEIKGVVGAEFPYTGSGALHLRFGLNPESVL